MPLAARCRAGCAVSRPCHSSFFPCDSVMASTLLPLPFDAVLTLSLRNQPCHLKDGKGQELGISIWRLSLGFVSLSPSIPKGGSAPWEVCSEGSVLLPRGSAQNPVFCHLHPPGFWGRGFALLVLFKQCEARGWGLSSSAVSTLWGAFSQQFRTQTGRHEKYSCVALGKTSL